MVRILPKVHQYSRRPYGSGDGAPTAVRAGRRSLLNVPWLVAIVFVAVCFATEARSALAQMTVAEVAGVNSSLKQPIASAKEFVELLRQTEISDGDGRMIAYIDAGKLTRRQYLHLYLIARAAAAGWLRPLLSDFGATAPPCSEQELALQTYFVATYEEPVWCANEQWRAAQWIYHSLNQLTGLGDEDWVIRKIYFLLHTVSSDLSALEVEAAVTGRYPSLRIGPSAVKPVQQPYKSELADARSLSSFEGWEPWVGAQDERMHAVDAVFFANQEVRAKHLLGLRSGLLRPDKISWMFSSTKSRYLVGNELVLRGAFEMGFKSDIVRDPRPNYAPESEYAGLYLLANTIVLDSSEAGKRFGFLDYADFYEYPVLTVGGSGSTGLILMARKIALGQFAQERIRRIWQAIGEPEYPTTGDCGIGARVIEFARKQIAGENLHINGLLRATTSANCFDRLFIAWQLTAQNELEARPSNVLHRFIQVSNGGIRQPVFAKPSIDGASAYFGSDLLERWNLAVVKQMLLRVRTAQLQDDREQMGTLMREAEGLRTRFLVNPSSSTVGEILSSFEALGKIKDSIRGKRLLIRGTAIADAPSISRAVLLGDAASKDTWLVPTSVAIKPNAGTAQSHRFARVLTSDQGQNSDVRLQIALQLYAPPSLQRDVQHALAARGLRYAGVAEDVQFLQVRQTQSSDWVIEDQSQIGPTNYIITLRCSQSYFPVLLEQLGRRPGLPIQIDWQSLSDKTVSSSSAGPVIGVLSFQGNPDSLSVSSAGTIENDSSLPLEIAGLIGSDWMHPVMPSVPLPARSKVVVGDLVAGLKPGQTIQSALIVWDPSASVAAKDKVSFVAPNWSIVPIQLANQSDLIGNQPVKELEVLLSALDDKGGLLYDSIRVGLARFGLPDARREIKLFVPPGFRIRYASQYTLIDGSVRSGPSGETDSIQIAIRYPQQP